jgi:hypothetical protein
MCPMLIQVDTASFNDRLDHIMYNRAVFSVPINSQALLLIISANLTRTSATALIVTQLYFSSLFGHEHFACFIAPRRLIALESIALQSLSQRDWATSCCEIETSKLAWIFSRTFRTISSSIIVLSCEHSGKITSRRPQAQGDETLSSLMTVILSRIAPFRHH